MMTMMFMMMTFGTTVEARGRERARWSPREVTCEGTEREGARRVVETAASLFDDAFGAVRDVEDRGAGRAREWLVRAIEPREEERRGREVTIDVPAVMRGKGFVLYASEGKLMKIGRERGLTRRDGCRDTFVYCDVGECPMSRTRYVWTPSSDEAIGQVKLVALEVSVSSSGRMRGVTRQVIPLGRIAALSRVESTVDSSVETTVEGTVENEDEVKDTSEGYVASTSTSVPEDSDDDKPEGYAASTSTSVPEDSDDDKPEGYAASTSTSAPEDTSEPEGTDEPEDTSEPEGTDEPEDTSEPEGTDEPEDTSEPEGTDEPEDTSEPEGTDEPEDTSEPEGTDEPEDTSEPEGTDEPEDTSEPEGTDEPEDTSEPEGTDEPEDTSEPEGTDEPEDTSVPEQSAVSPESTVHTVVVPGTTLPSTTSTPEDTSEPEGTDEPEDTSKPEDANKAPSPSTTVATNHTSRFVLRLAPKAQEAMDKVREMERTMADEGDEVAQSQNRTDALRDEISRMKQRARQGKVSGRAIKRDLKRKQQQCKRSVKKENKRETRRRQRRRNSGSQPPLQDPARACDPSLDADLSSLSAKMRGLVQPVLDAKTAIQAKDDEIEKADRQADTLKQELREIFKTTRKAEATKREEEKTLKNLVKECERTFRKENAKIQRKKTRGKKSAYVVHDAVLCARISQPSTSTTVATLAALGARIAPSSNVSSTAALLSFALVAAAAALGAAVARTRLLARRRRLARDDERTKLIVA
jgi:hypothetical protein